MIIWTALPIGEYAAVTLLMFFGLKSIKDAWDLPSIVVKSGDKSGPELDEFVEAEELVKEKVVFLKPAFCEGFFRNEFLIFSDAVFNVFRCQNDSQIHLKSSGSHLALYSLL